MPTTAIVPATVAVDLGEFAKLIARTIEVFGTAERAVRWLETSNPELDGMTPLTTFQSGGLRQVEEELIAIEHGITA